MFMLNLCTNFRRDFSTNCLILRFIQENNSDGSLLQLDLLPPLKPSPIPGISLMIWLLGYELRDTIMFFTMEDIFVISSKKKTDFLRPLRDVLSKKDDMPNMTLLTRMKVGNVKSNFIL